MTESALSAPDNPSSVPGWLRLATRLCWHLSGPILFLGFLAPFLQFLLGDTAFISSSLYWIGGVLFVLAWILVTLVWMLQPPKAGEGGRGLKGTLIIVGILVGVALLIGFGRSLDINQQPALTIAWPFLRFIFVVGACFESIMRRPPFLPKSA